jgi:hypothetical protein
MIYPAWLIPSCNNCHLFIKLAFQECHRRFDTQHTKPVWIGKLLLLIF